MNKREKITQFLAFFQDIIEENPEIDFSHPNTEDIIYHQLTHLGVKEEEKEAKISYFFPNWINQFPDFHLGEVDRNQYFCQFTSFESQFHTTRDSIKIYLPQDLDHIEESVNDILQFLEEYHIPHITNVASRILNDDIVIHLLYPEDADLLNRFIQNNEHIQEGMLEANPFAFQRNGVAYVNDGTLSFLRTISNYIRLYLSEKQKTNTVEDICVEDFYQFIQSYYEEVLENFDDTDRLIQDFAIDGRYPRNTNETIVGYQNITKLILQASDEEFTYEDYLKHVADCQNDVIQEKKISTLAMLRDPSPKKLTQEEVKQVRTFLLQALRTMTNKYGRTIAVQNIREYIRRNDPSFLTRENGLRDLLTSVNFRDSILRLLAEEKVSLRKYIESIDPTVKEVEKETEEEPASLVLEEEKETVEEEPTPLVLQEKEDTSLEKTTMRIISIMERNYNLISAVNALKLYIETAKANYLTRDYGLREEIVQSDFRNQLLTQLEQKGLSFNDYASNLINQGKMEFYQKEALEKAVIETYLSKEEGFQQGLSSVSGEEFIKLSLARFLTSGQYNSFTRRNDARKDVISFLSSQQAIDLMRKELKFPPQENCSDEEITLLSEQYVEMLVQKVLQERSQKVA